MTVEEFLGKYDPVVMGMHTDLCEVITELRVSRDLDDDQLEEFKRAIVNMVSAALLESCSKLPELKLDHLPPWALEKLQHIPKDRGRV